MAGKARRRLLDLARSLVGALLLGVPLLYTMETWWLGWRLPAWLLLLYSVGGLVVISVLTHFVGYHKEDHPDGSRVVQEAKAFLELFATSFVAGVIVLLLMGIPQDRFASPDVLRLALIEVVPLGLGASLTNLALSSAEDEQEDGSDFVKEGATFAVGAVFFALPIAPTEEMQLIAAHAGPWRLVALLLASLVITHLTLYVLNFRGHAGRHKGAGSFLVQAGETMTGYAIALVVSLGLLGGFGHLLEANLSETLQEGVTLAFVASLGGAAARVVV